MSFLPPIFAVGIGQMFGLFFPATEGTKPPTYGALEPPASEGSDNRSDARLDARDADNEKILHAPSSFSAAPGTFSIA